jgi:hypothetical protein
MNFAVLSILFLLLTGWMQQSCEIKDVAMNKEFKLKAGEVAEVSDAGIKVSLNGVLEDSRCPTGVQCVWAGNGKVSLKLIKGKGEPVSVELNTYAGPKSHKFEGYDVRLMALDPYPKDGAQTSKDAYVVTLMVCRNCGDAGGGAQETKSEIQ